jgi:hypothetical protein
MSRVEIVPSRLTHVGPIANRMREIDRIEAAAMGRTPRQALRLGIRCSHYCWTAMVDGRPEAMLGVTPISLLSGKGIPWLLGTDALFKQARALMTLGPPVIGVMLRTFPHLSNLVACENVKAIRLLRRWGFTIGEETMLIGGVAFIPFRLDRPSIQARRAAR